MRIKQEMQHEDEHPKLEDFDINHIEICEAYRIGDLHYVLQNLEVVEHILIKNIIQKNRQYIKLMKWLVEMCDNHSQNLDSFPTYDWGKNVREVNPQFLFILGRN